MSGQAPSAVVMVRPHHFTPNPHTATDNVFQAPPPPITSHSGSDTERDPRATAAFHEVTALAEALQGAGIEVHLFEDEGTTTPDSVFPNNWFSTHRGGHVALYPMHTPNRRGERRADVIEFLKSTYRVQDVIDYSGLEHDHLFLEGTGAMVLDHVDRVAYVARSRRADPVILERFCTNFGYEPMLFDAADDSGTAIYHTNVLMTVGTAFALVGLDTIRHAARRDEIADRLTQSGRDVIALSTEQVHAFAGNCLELVGSDGRVVAMSQRAHDALTPPQRARLERSARILSVPVPTIELAGGSVRCMLAEVHLTRRAPVRSCDAAPDSTGTPTAVPAA